MVWVPPPLIPLPKNADAETRKRYFSMYLGTLPDKIVKKAIKMDRMPVEEFKNPWCKGSMILGNHCGKCERCAWEEKQLKTKNKYFEAYCALESVTQYHKSVQGNPPIKSYGRETLRHIDAILDALKQLSDAR